MLQRIFDIIERAWVGLVLLLILGGLGLFALDLFGLLPAKVKEANEFAGAVVQQLVWPAYKAAFALILEHWQAIAFCIAAMVFWAFVSWRED